MGNKVVVKKLSDDMPDQRELEAADALLELSREAGLLPENHLPSPKRKLSRMDCAHKCNKVIRDAHKHGKSSNADNCESDNHSNHGGVEFGMDEKPNASANKPINIRFVMEKSAAETNQKKRKAKEGDSSMSFDKAGDKLEDNPHDHDRELYDDDEHKRNLRKKGKQSIEASGFVRQEYYFNMKHLENKMAEACWQRTSYAPHLHVSDQSDIAGTSSPMSIDRPVSLNKNLNFVQDGFGPVLSDAARTGEVQPYSEPTRRRPSTSMTSPSHPGFSFSIIHLLSAVRVALIIPHSGNRDLSDGNGVEEADERKKHPVDIDRENLEGSIRLHNNGKGIIISDNLAQRKLPSLTLRKIVHRVISSPGDPRIIETRMSLGDLVRGVLNIFTSKTAPPGATYWKPLTEYDKTSKTWSWIGPVPSRLPHKSGVDEQISPVAWGVSRRIISKLVDSYAHWMITGLEVLEKLGNLPPPPEILMQCPSLDERLNDRRAMKGLITIIPSNEEVRAYFRLEEALRYSVPDRAFPYTALDGRKSRVAPLTRRSGKPTSRIRDHFILKQDRPPQFTVLCLVRDAAARLPAALGKRLDICTLVRDSQYILEDVGDLQISQVVSGALDRLHYEDDPCVRYDRNWSLWIYLHRDKEEEDFDENSTSSRKTKKDNAKLAEESGSAQGSM